MFWAILAVAAALRLTAIHYGLPAIFNADEPHFVSIAVSFGGGNLHPHLFKYPTLWMYVLFAAYGIYYLIWSGLGLLRSVRDFGVLFAWDPGSFVLIGRVLAASFSVAAIAVVYSSCRRAWGRTAAWTAAALLAAAPVLVEAAHASKPESMLFFLSACAWAFALRFVLDGKRRDLWLCGAFVGFCFATQYTALPLGALPLAAFLSRRLRAGAAKFRDLAAAYGFLAAALFIGSPYLFLDFPAFRLAVEDMMALGRVGEPVGAKTVLRNIWLFSGPWPTGGALLLLGVLTMLRARREWALLVLLPIGAFVLALSGSPDGSWLRYLIACFGGLAFAASAGVDAVLSWAARGPSWTRHRLWPAAVALAASLPGFWASAAFDRVLLLPDTRTLSAAWMLEHIPQPSVLLLDQEHASPRLPLSRAMLERLLEQTARAGHPKKKLYEMMLAGHPGGGYDIYRVARDYRDLRSYPGHAAFSAAAQPVLDVRGGLAAAKKAGVEYVALTGFGAWGLSEFFAFVGGLERQGRLLAEFFPERGRRTGPAIRLYALPRR